MIPTDPQDDVATAMPDDAVSPDEVAADLSPGAQPEPEEETNEQWRLRFIEENQHLLPPRPERPPPPPPSPWDGPRSSWKVPDHLSLRHPKGGYMAMALMSRTMDDLDEVTKGERAATYEEVDTYLGHALIAEGLVPFTYTADEAIRWWKSGGYKVLGGGSIDPLPNLPDISSPLTYDGKIDPRHADDRAADGPYLSNAAFMVDPNAENAAQARPAKTFNGAPSAFETAAPIEDSSGGFADDATGLLKPISFVPDTARNPIYDAGGQIARRLDERRKKLMTDLKEESLEVAFNLVNLNSNAANALANSMRGSQARDLTAGERKRIVEAFGTMIDLSNVKIVIGPGNNPLAKVAFDVGDNPAITVGNTVYINAEKVKGSYSYYRGDFSKTDQSLKRIIHEFYHVVQYQRHGFQDFGSRYGAEEMVFGPSLKKGFDRDAVYDYDKRSRAFDNETIEGQAEMAGRYAELRSVSKPSTLAERRQLEARLKGSGIYGF